MTSRLQLTNWVESTISTLPWQHKFFLWLKNKSFYSSSDWNDLVEKQQFQSSLWSKWMHFFRVGIRTLRPLGIYLVFCQVSSSSSCVCKFIIWAFHKCHTCLENKLFFVLWDNITIITVLFHNEPALLIILLAYYLLSQSTGKLSFHSNL